MNSASADSRRRLIAVALFVLAAIAAHLHLRAVLETQVVEPIRADARDYFAGAVNLMKYGVYSQTVMKDGTPPPPDAIRTPGYSMMLVPLLGDGDITVGDFLKRATLLNALLGVLLVPLSWWLARKVVGPMPALAVAALVAITPQLVTSSTYLLTEVTFAFATVVAVIALAACVERPRPAWVPFAAGLAVGIATLVRPTLQFLPIAFLLFACAMRSVPDRKRVALLVVLGFAIPFGAWTARNLATLGRASDPTITIGTIHHGSYPGFMYRDDPATYGYPYRADPDTPRIIESTGTVLAHVADQFREQPLRMLSWYLVEKPFHLVAWEPIQGMGDVFVYEVQRSPYFSRPEFVATKQLMRAIHWPLMLLGYAGALLVWLPVASRVLGEPAARVARLLSVVLAYVVAIHMVGAPFPRYSVPFRPLQYALAVAAVVIAVRAFHARRA